MLNYGETARVSTTVPLLSVLSRQHQQPITEPLPAMTQAVGREAGRAEARALLTQAEQDKGEALTKGEVRQDYVKRFSGRMQQYDRGELPRPWVDGWCQGFVEVCIQAERVAPDDPVLVEEEPPLARTLVRFRQAAIAVEDADAFLEGVLCGQVCAVEETKPLTSQRLFALLEDAVVRDEEASETWLAGYVLGLADAICGNRKHYPRGWR